MLEMYRQDDVRQDVLQRAGSGELVALEPGSREVDRLLAGPERAAARSGAAAARLRRRRSTAGARFCPLRQPLRPPRRAQT